MRTRRRIGLVSGLALLVGLIASPTAAQAPRDSSITAPLLRELRTLLVRTNSAYSDTLVHEVAELHSSFGDRTTALEILRDHQASWYGYARVALVDLRRDDLEGALFVARQPNQPTARSQAAGYVASALIGQNRFEEARQIGRDSRLPRQRVAILKEAASRLLRRDSAAARAFLSEAVETAQADTSTYGRRSSIQLVYDQIVAGDYSGIDRVVSDTLPRDTLAIRLGEVAYAFTGRGDSVRSRVFGDRARMVAADIAQDEIRGEIERRLVNLLALDTGMNRGRWIDAKPDTSMHATRLSQIREVTRAHGIAWEDRDLVGALGLFDSLLVSGSSEDVVRAAAELLGPLWVMGGKLFGLAELRGRTRYRAMRDQAVARTDEIEDLQVRSSLLDDLAGRLFTLDRDLALDLVLRIPVGHSRDRALNRFVMARMRVDPDSATALLALVTAGGQKQDLQEAIVLAKIARSPMSTDSLVATFEEASSRASVLESLARLAHRDGDPVADELILQSLGARSPPTQVTAFEYAGPLLLLLERGRFDLVLDWVRGQRTQQARMFALIQVGRAIERSLGWYARR